MIQDTWKKIPGIEEAIERIKHSIIKNEKIYIYGDFDVDGLSATIILFKTLKYLGGNISIYIPDRISEGHSLNRPAIKKISQKSSLIITVDCGITSFQEVKYANYLGVDVIITDHHSIENKIPNSFSTITPPDELLTDFSGAGVSFKLCQGLLNDPNHELIPDLLAFAALGTITDCVDQKNENRVIISLGLKFFSEVKSIGLQQIMENAKVKFPVSEYDISWKISPRLNSASRLGQVNVAVYTLFSEKESSAIYYSEQLEKINSKRKKIVSEVFKFAQSKICEFPAIVLKFSDFIDVKNNFKRYKGIQGILAGKICGEYSIPTFIFSETYDGILEGSSRSLYGYHINDVIDENRHLLISGGGHKLAGGMSLYSENLEKFKERIYDYVENQVVIPPSKNRNLELSLSELSIDLYSKLVCLEPFGNEGPPIWSITSKLSSQPRVMGSDKKHLSFEVSDNTNKFRVVGWGMGHRIKELDMLKDINLQCQIVLNEYKNRNSIELHLKEFSQNV